VRSRILSKIAPKLHVWHVPLPKPQIAVAPPDPTEPHYTVAQLAEMWQLDAKIVRGWFRHAPGVLRTGEQRKSLRIPRSVMERVHRARTGVQG
jgi:hypothetical protein